MFYVPVKASKHPDVIAAASLENNHLEWTSGGRRLNMDLDGYEQETKIIDFLCLDFHSTTGINPFFLNHLTGENIV